MAICDLDVAPAFERSKHHEEIGGAIALVLIIETGRASRFHRDRHARFGNELLRGLVEANQRTIAVAWPRVDGQHVFHSGYERAVGLRRDDPARAQSCCRWHDRQCRVLPPCSPTTARSSVRVPWAAWNRPRQSAWPPSRRQKSEQRQASRAACGSTRPRSLLPPVVCAPGKPSMGWFPELRRSGCRSTLCQLPRHRPSTRSAPSVPGAPGSFLSEATFQAVRVPRRSASQHTRDSPDESQTGINVRVFPALLQDRREVLTATSTSDNPNAWSRV